MRFTTADIISSIEEEKKSPFKGLDYIVALHINRVNSKGKKGNIITVYDKLSKTFVYRCFCSNSKISNNLKYIREYYGKTRCQFSPEVESQYLNDKADKSSDIK